MWACVFYGNSRERAKIKEIEVSQFSHSVLLIQYYIRIIFNNIFKTISTRLHPSHFIIAEETFIIKIMNYNRIIIEGYVTI